MTDPKEAAIQRMRAAIVAEYDRQRKNQDVRSVEPLWDALARIAIEKGVVPAVQADRQAIMDALDNMEATGADSGSVDDLPWDAVCAEKKP